MLLLKVCFYLSSFLLFVEVNIVFWKRLDYETCNISRDLCSADLLETRRMKHQLGAAAMIGRKKSMQSGSRSVVVEVVVPQR